jgi:hypothetical protein
MGSEHNGGAVIAANLKLIEICEGGPYELRGFLIRMTTEGPQVIGDMVLRIDHPNMLHTGLTLFRGQLKTLMKSPEDILTPDPDTVRQINRTKGS